MERCLACEADWVATHGYSLSAKICSLPAIVSGMRDEGGSLAFYAFCGYSCISATKQIRRTRPPGPSRPLSPSRPLFPPSSASANLPLAPHQSPFTFHFSLFTSHFSPLTRTKRARMRLNSFQGKRLLALARGGDYAHAGETESIDLVWNRLPKDPTQQVLDAGCGRGGTAAYIQRAGWGKVTGIDIERESIQRAREIYPDVTFDVRPVEQADRIGTAQFDVICCFNSFYAFGDQPAALRAFAHNAKPGAQLAIFEYTDPGTFKESALGQHVELLGWHPLILSTISALLNETGWKLDTIQDLTADYIRWYKTFSNRIRELQTKLIEECGVETWEYASNFYDLMHETIKTGHMGGAIVYAKRTAN